MVLVRCSSFALLSAAPWAPSLILGLPDRRECPNGPSCMYRHALPPGFVLKSQKKKSEDDAKKNEISLEEFLEV